MNPWNRRPVVAPREGDYLKERDKAILEVLTEIRGYLSEILKYTARIYADTNFLVKNEIKTEIKL